MHSKTRRESAAFCVGRAGRGGDRSVRGAGKSVRPIKRKATWAARRGVRVPAGSAVPESPLADFGSVSGGGRCGVARGLTAAAKPARPIKKKAAPMAGQGVRFPAGCAVPESPLADFGSVWGMAGRGVTRRAGGSLNSGLCVPIWRYTLCAGPSRVGRRGCRQRKGYGDAGRAAPRLRWGAAAPAENRRQRNDTGGPGVPRTPGRRPPHRNGGTFGSFSHERTT